MKLVFGEGAVVVTKGQRVIPERTLAHGYTFAYPTIDAAFAQIAGVEACLN
jgi:NAD dependent epimerase/dehydratase family enzyme